MAAKNDRPLLPEDAPDTARVYERAKPEAEAGMGKLHIGKMRPALGRDRSLDGASNQHKSHQINSEDTVNNAGGPVTHEVGPRRKTRSDVAAEKRAKRQKAQRKIQPGGKR
jgi:hypothetical protein